MATPVALLFLQGPHLAQNPLFSRHCPQVIFSRYFLGGKDNKELAVTCILL